jgi:hypothetical protein
MWINLVENPGDGLADNKFLTMPSLDLPGLIMKTGS